MTICQIEEQITFINKWGCAFLINNDPVSLFDILSVSISLLMFVWLFSMLFTSRILRVVCRSLSIAFTLSFVPIPAYILIPYPSWPFLLIRHSNEWIHITIWWTFYFFLIVSMLWLGLVEYFRHKRDERKREEKEQERKRYARTRRVNS